MSPSGSRRPFAQEVKNKGKWIPGCLADRNSALLEVILEFRDADEVEVKDGRCKQDRGPCLDSIIEMLQLPAPPEATTSAEVVALIFGSGEDHIRF